MVLAKEKILHLLHQMPDQVDVDFIVAQQNFVVFPLLQRVQIIRTHNEHEFMIWKFFMQISQRINGVRRARQF